MSMNLDHPHVLLEPENQLVPARKKCDGTWTFKNHGGFISNACIRAMQFIQKIWILITASPYLQEYTVIVETNISCNKSLNLLLTCVFNVLIRNLAFHPYSKTCLNSVWSNIMQIDFDMITSSFATSFLVYTNLPTFISNMNYYCRDLKKK